MGLVIYSVPASLSLNVGAWNVEMDILRSIGLVVSMCCFFAIAFGGGTIVPRLATFLLVDPDKPTHGARILFAVFSLSLSISSVWLVSKMFKSKTGYSNLLIAIFSGLALGSLSVFILGSFSGWADLFR